jgi:hypothetical protein
VATAVADVGAVVAVAVVPADVVEAPPEHAAVAVTIAATAAPWTTLRLMPGPFRRMITAVMMDSSV